MTKTTHKNQWSSPRVFYMAIIGSAVGLGTIWRFPYITGENGGGAFVLIYVASMMIIGIPLIMAELAIGRRGGGSAIKTMKVLTEEEGAHKAWRALGWLSILAPFIGLMFMSVVGQAFFSLSIAVGALITYGAYLPKHVSITKAAFVIGFADTLTALLVGMVVFPLVITYGLQSGEGPGLVFLALPIAFGTMPFGLIFGVLFFTLMLMAALTSSMGMLEPVVAWVNEFSRFTRRTNAFLVGGFAWVCGLSAVLSFNILSDFYPLDQFNAFEGKGIFDLLDYSVANILIPAGGLLIALFAGWVLSRQSIEAELNMTSKLGFKIWLALIRFVAPAAILLIFLGNMFG